MLCEEQIQTQLLCLVPQPVSIGAAEEAQGVMSAYNEN